MGAKGLVRTTGFASFYVASAAGPRTAARKILCVRSGACAGSHRGICGGRLR